MNKKAEKEKINTYKIFVIFLFIILIISGIILAKYQNKIELTNLQNNTSRQMMGQIIKTKTNKLIVIDGGEKGDTQNLIKNIQDSGGKVDYWFITHPHIDHMGAFLEIVNNTNIEIGKIYTTYNDLTWYKEYSNEREGEFENIEEFFETIKNQKIAKKIELVTLNQNIKIDNVSCEILGIANPEIIENAANNSSMVIKIEVNDKSILFLADTGKESEEKLIKTQKDKLKSDIVQVAHHGQNGATEKLYKIIKPKICIWPTPEWLWNNDAGNGENSGPWKTKETRQWMEKLEVKQNIISKDGDTTINIW